jgi:hypothetical protein
MSEIFESLELSSIEAIAAIHRWEGEYKSRIAAAQEAITAIFKKFKSREEEIANNADRYEQSKVVDQQFNLRKSVRQSLEELIKGRGFLSEIDACREELEKDDKLNDIQTLTQTMREIEMRQAMTAAGQDFQMTFQAAITDGDPLTISALENAPVPFPVDAGMLKDGKKRRLEVLKPVVAKRFHLLQEAQSTIEGMASAIMPIKKDDIDPLRDLLEEG